MWGRYAEKDFYGIAMVIAILFCSLRLSAQNLPKAIQNIIQVNAEAGVDVEGMVEFYEEILNNPLKINIATDENLYEVGLFSDFQIKSLREYLGEYEKILSFAELALIDGFNENIVENLKPFLSLETLEKPIFSRPKNNLIFRSRFKSSDVNKEYLGIPIYFYSKYRLVHGKKMQFGFTFENDVGEKYIPDFSSGYIYFSDLSLSKSISINDLVIGDYSARFGQGLSLWKAFSLSSISYPSSVYKRSMGIKPYTSSDEQNFFRGLGINFGIFDDIELSVFYSENKVDARIEGDEYISLPSGGYHNTESLLSTRKTLGERVLGGNLAYVYNSFRLGFTSLIYSFDKRNGRNPNYYNKYQMYEGGWGNYSLDLYLTRNRYRFFGELAFDFNFTPAILLGSIYQGDGLDASILFRYYPKEYIARHGGAFSSKSSISNQNGVSFSLRYLMPKSIIEVNSDAVYYPGQRYGVKSDSFALKFYSNYLHRLNDLHELSFRVSTKWVDYQSEGNLRLRLDYSYMGELEVSTRFEFSNNTKEKNIGKIGSLFYLDLNYDEKRWNSGIRLTLFHIDDWDSRIYAYEKDLPQAFSVPAYYGRGFSIYMIGGYRPTDWSRVVLKLSANKYFPQEKDYISAKIQLNLSFPH